MLIKLSVVGDNVSVVVGITDADSAVGVDSYVVVSVSDVKLLVAALGLDRPMYLSVFLADRVDLKNVRNEIIIVKAVLDDLA